MRHHLMTILLQCFWKYRSRLCSTNATSFMSIKHQHDEHFQTEYDCPRHESCLCRPRHGHYICEVFVWYRLYAAHWFKTFRTINTTHHQLVPISILMCSGHSICYKPNRKAYTHAWNFVYFICRNLQRSDIISGFETRAQCHGSAYRRTLRLRSPFSAHVQAPIAIWAKCRGSAYRRILR